MERLGFSASGMMSGLVPFLCSVIAVASPILPVSFFGGLVPPPLAGADAGLFLVLVRPDLMPPALAFAIGVLEDLFSGGPPGVWAASFVAAYALIDRQRDSFAGLSGIGAILGFAAAMLVTATTAYVIVAIYYARLPPVAPWSWRSRVSVLFYVPVAVRAGLDPSPSRRPATERSVMRSDL